MIRLALAFLAIAVPIGAVFAYGDPQEIAKTTSAISQVLRQSDESKSRSVEIQRRDTGEFKLRAKVNDTAAAMVIDTGATSVMLTYETAQAAGLPIELLNYNVDVETASGHTRAARLTIDRLAVGSLVEHAVPALVVPKGQLRTNLLGMSFLNRLESWEVRTDRLKLRGYP